MNDSVTIYDKSFSVQDLKQFFGIDLENPLCKQVMDGIRGYLSEHSLGRRLLDVDNLNGRGLASYRREVFAKAYVISRRGAVPDQVIENSEVIVPTFDIASMPQFDIGMLVAGDVSNIESVINNIGKVFANEETSNVLNALFYASEKEGIVVDGLDYITINELDAAYTRITSNGGVPSFMICSPEMIGRLEVRMPSGNWKFDGSGGENGGYFRSAQIYVTNRIERDRIIFCGKPGDVGKFVVEHNPLFVKCNSENRLRVGCVCWEKIGICILNDYLVSSIRVAEFNTIEPSVVEEIDGEDVVKPTKVKPNRKNYNR